MKQRSVCIFGRQRPVTKISQQRGHNFFNAILDAFLNARLDACSNRGPNICEERFVWWIDEHISYVFRWNIPLTFRLFKRWERVETGDKIVYVV